MGHGWFSIATLDYRRVRGRKDTFRVLDPFFVQNPRFSWSKNVQPTVFSSEQSVSFSTIHCVKSINPHIVFLWWSNLQFHHPEGCLILFNPCILWHTTTVCHHAPPWNQQLPSTAPGTTNAAPSAIAGTFHRRSSQRCSLGDHHQGHGYGWVRIGKFISWKSPKLPWKNGISLVII